MDKEGGDTKKPRECRNSKKTEIIKPGKQPAGSYSVTSNLGSEAYIFFGFLFSQHLSALSYQQFFAFSIFQLISAIVATSFLFFDIS